MPSSVGGGTLVECIGRNTLQPASDPSLLKEANVMTATDGMIK